MSAPFFRVGAVCNPKFDKRYKGGEDGFVVAQNQRMIMVADGVGGWTNRGVDPGKYSKALCKQVGVMFDKESDKSLDTILTEADKVNPHSQGSSTAVMAKLTPDSNYMKTCNLGDSSYMIIRPQLDGRLTKVFRSQE